MLRLRYSAHSKIDLARIWDYISDDSPRNAAAVLDRIFERCELLREQPRMGHRRDDLHRGTRCVTSDGYMILYRYFPGLVRIDRVVHHSRQLDHLFSDDPP